MDWSFMIGLAAIALVVIGLIVFFARKLSRPVQKLAPESDLAMSTTLTVLEESISDAGYWRWWDESLPSLFGVEFGGVKLWSPPRAPDLPPPGIVGLAFRNPFLVAFITADSAQGLRGDWRMALHNDEIELFFMFDDFFTLQSSDLFGRIVADCSIEYLVGGEAELAKTSTVQLGFRSGPVGLIVRAEAMAVHPFSKQAQVLSARDAWERYYDDYWSRRDTESPMPSDNACEAMIPLDRFIFPEDYFGRPPEE
jgi:hypothetical protein